jgi:hypothetical protein
MGGALENPSPCRGTLLWIQGKPPSIPGDSDFIRVPEGQGPSFFERALQKGYTQSGINPRRKSRVTSSSHGGQIYPSGGTPVRTLR